MNKNEGPERHLCFKLGKVNRKIYRHCESELAPFNITPAQFYALSVLFNNDGIKFKDMALRLNLDRSSLTGILDRMEKGGFIERRADPDDRRSILIFLTDKSKKIGPELYTIAWGLDQKFKNKISPEELKILLKVLEQL
ncbi:MarR family winged helix-turn-helix transcriptional regulator [Methanobacterium petrolearium]|uniref:MarR family winged helix-turn-helix transcriptional regulator n=1 Tax=Methanobacterium petrolearium TaxID=710190 RepID=UPI001AE9AFDD|nr:DNA-binding MarR family transcriptional regulator [Methanobacterium petrolearium]BDZ70875.1 MarR family transcriptional regulator [Methanobacterium petrolearium]